MAYWWGWGNQVQYLVVGVDGKVRRTVDIALPGGPMMHDCAITEKYVLIFDLPCLFNLELAMSGRSFPYIWNADYTARVGLLPREGVAADIKWVEINSCYIFHPLNAYDAPDGTVVLDAARHEKMFDVEQRGPNEGFPTLDRWVLNPKTGKATEQRLDERLADRYATQFRLSCWHLRCFQAGRFDQARFGKENNASAARW
jgi:carotenoid cleavage dioxygenase